MMAAPVNFAVAPKLRGIVVLWAIWQTALIVLYFRGQGNPHFRLAFLGISSTLVFLGWAIVAIWCYRSLCRLRERGVVVDGEVEAHSRFTYSVIYCYAGVQYKLDGKLDYFDRSVWRTFPPEYAAKTRVPVRFLVDPDKPTTHYILPFETDQGR